MRLEALPDAATLLAVSAEFRAREPVLTNVIGSIAEGVLGGRRYESETWLVVSEGAAVVGCAVRTGPFSAVLSPMPGPAATAVGHWLAEHDPAVPGLTGPVEAVEAAAHAAGRALRIGMSEVVRVLDRLVPADPDRMPSGAARRATRDDLDLLMRWLPAFEIEAGLPPFANPAHTGEQVDGGRLFLWCVDGAPVTVAGHAPVVTTPGATIGRVGPVYTPPQHRRHGYGTAATRAVTEDLLGRCDHVMLFADAQNPDSNSIYEAMGFRVVAHTVDAVFVYDPPAGTP